MMVILTQEEYESLSKAEAIWKQTYHAKIVSITKAFSEEFPPLFMKHRKSGKMHSALAYELHEHLIKDMLSS